MNRPKTANRWLLPGLYLGVFMVILDVFIVMVGGLISLDLLGLGWRWVFLVNVAVGLAALVAAGRVVPESRSPGTPRLDVPGVVLATLTLALLMVRSSRGATWAGRGGRARCGPGAYGTAFATACAVQAALALVAAGLVARARVTPARRARASRAAAWEA